MATTTPGLLFPSTGRLWSRSSSQDCEPRWDDRQKAKASTRLPATSPEPFVESPPSPSVVFVIERDTPLRRSLDALPPDEHRRVETVASISALLAPQRTCAPSCLVLDVSRPDSELPLPPWPMDIPVICVVDPTDISRCVRAMKAGAVDVLSAPVGSAPLLDAIRLAWSCSEIRLRRETELEGMRKRYASLSPREREVMVRVTSGLLNKQVAEDLGISVTTVKAHRGRVMRKMSARSAASLVMMAIMLQSAPSEQLARAAPAQSAIQTSADERQSRDVVGQRLREGLADRRR
jgi:FixJ family two-component response regulator